ncbi:gustatory receptor for sugar taste 64f-like [Aphidius gifuensis]|uniref:gustatory receptor for sugar taste 64f-like n=1 Tax=Aphidius gifuensis TaxID=684658 RepID=UPI001CDD36F2|nr:gustatory receptor for sugar taste 64f-like [Aphidius gifuensis]
MANFFRFNETHIKFKQEPEYFHRSMKYILKFCQLFGVFPMSGISNNNPDMLSKNINIVSIGLAERYKFLNKITMKTKIWNDHDTYWCQVRMNYTNLSKLVKHTNDIISPLIFLSFSHNFFYVCISLFEGISLDRYDILSLYPIYSFINVLMRMIAVMFSTSIINNQSKLVLPKVYSCPSNKFTIETERLLNQIANDNIAFTGMKFFFLTRSFIVAVGSTIVSYEIILLKFSSLSIDSNTTEKP